MARGTRKLAGADHLGAGRRIVRAARATAAAGLLVGVLTSGVTFASPRFVLHLPGLGRAVLEGSHDVYADTTGQLDLTETVEARLLAPGPLHLQAFVASADDRPAQRQWRWDVYAVESWQALDVTEGLRADVGGRPIVYVDVNWAW